MNHRVMGLEGTSEGHPGFPMSKDKSAVHVIPDRHLYGFQH